MNIRPPTDRLIVRLLPEKASATLNGHSSILITPDKRDRYLTGEHVPDVLRIACVLALGAKARVSLGCRPRRVLIHFASGEPLGDGCRLLTPEQCIGVLE